MLLLVALVSTALSFNLLQQSYSSAGCNGAAFQMAVVTSPGPTCPYPARLCIPSPTNSSNSVSVECTTYNGLTYPFPSGYAAQYTFQGSQGCSGNTSVANAFLANSCISPAPNQHMLWNCNTNTVTNCVGTQGCSDPSCTTGQLPTGCISTGPLSELLKCIK
jgi:hypothetical protein